MQLVTLHLGKLLRWYGIDRDKRNYKGKDFRLESDVTEYGFKMHMNDFAASLGKGLFSCGVHYLTHRLKAHDFNP
jgi:hypothetical protein